MSAGAFFRCTGLTAINIPQGANVDIGALMNVQD